MSDPESAVWIWRYTLVSAGALNRASARRVHQGALIRAADGYGCIHPWPELGDATLEQELASLRHGQPLRLAANALACARIDGAARRRGHWLFKGFDMPASHALWTSDADPSPASMRQRVRDLIGEGFDALKIKLGPPGDECLKLLTAIAEAAEGRLKLRPDLNATLTESEFADFAARMGSRVRSAIEWIEDPLPYEPATWARLEEESGLPLTLDQDLDRGTVGYRIAVIKPSTLTTGAIRAAANHPVVVTSSMQHPVGQLYDAWMSRHLPGLADAPLAGCGLLTHECYATDPFIERMARSGPLLVPPAGGTGLGFDDLLESLPWTKWTHRRA